MTLVFRLVVSLIQRSEQGRAGGFTQTWFHVRYLIEISFMRKILGIVRSELLLLRVPGRRSEWWGQRNERLEGKGKGSQTEADSKRMTERDGEKDKDLPQRTRKPWQNMFKGWQPPLWKVPSSKPEGIQGCLLAFSCLKLQNVSFTINAFYKYSIDLTDWLVYYLVFNVGIQTCICRHTMRR